MVIILGIYGAFYFNDLRQVLTESYAVQVESRTKILGLIVQEIGLVILLAIPSSMAIFWKAVLRFKNQRPGLMLLIMIILPALLIAILMPAFYHFITSNGRSMWKHNVYTLVFLAPIVGYGIAELIDFIRTRSTQQGNRRVAFRAVSALLTVVLLLWFVAGAFRENDAFHRMWPNNAEVIEFMRTQNISPQSKVLSAGYAIYDYYFDFGVNDQNVWNNIWYTEYNGLNGTDAVRQAIRDCAYDMIVLDNYWAPEWAGELEFAVQEAGYVVAYSTTESVNEGSIITTNVYLPRCGRSQ